MTTPTSPIADLSYRHYDGPLNPPTFRWWCIAKASMRMNVKKTSFWAYGTISAAWYLVMAVVLYISATFGPSGMSQGLGEVHWRDEFLTAFGYSQLGLMLCALLLGAGAIANDNRANALLVYLSKPCTKLDYVMGKWVGIAIPITLMSAIPAIGFYGYCVASFRDVGFPTSPVLALDMLVLSLVPGILHASLALGISSLFRQGRLAGAAYAGLYFLSLFFTVIVGQILMATSGHVSGDVVPANGLLGNLYYCSVDGIQIGLAKIVLGVDGSRALLHSPFSVGIPSGWLLLLFLAISALACWVAWVRVRAVEVIG